jgi:hypothetical protein
MANALVEIIGEGSIQLWEYLSHLLQGQDLGTWFVDILRSPG